MLLIYIIFTVINLLSILTLTVSNYLIRRSMGMGPEEYDFSDICVNLILIVLGPLTVVLVILLALAMYFSLKS